MFAIGEVHCQYCMCPIEVWKHSMKTYDGDECELYDDFSSVIWEMEEAIKPFSNKDIIKKCQKNFESKYNDIKDFEASIYEMIEIIIDTGAMPKNYRPLELVRA